MIVVLYHKLLCGIPRMHDDEDRRSSHASLVEPSAFLSVDDQDKRHYFPALQSLCLRHHEILCRIPRMHNAWNDNTTVVVLVHGCIHGFVRGCVHVCVHGIPRTHDDENGMIILRSFFQYITNVVMIYHETAILRSLCSRHQASFRYHEYPTTRMIILRSLCLRHRSFIAAHHECILWSLCLRHKAHHRRRQFYSGYYLLRDYNPR